MKEFIEILKKHRDCDIITVLSVTSMTESYLLAVSYEWVNDVGLEQGYLEEAVFVIEEQHGPNKGKFRIGWTHKIYENTDELN